MNSSNAQKNHNTEAHARGIYLLAVACFPVLLAGCLSFILFASGAVQRDDGVRYQSDFAQFDYPRPGDRVSDQFTLRGTIKSVPAGETVYLAEMSEGHYWPKKHLGSTPTSFQRDQYANSGAGYKYSVVLLSVNGDGEAQIEKWFDHGRQTGKYPGIADIKNSTALARIRVVRQ